MIKTDVPNYYAVRPGVVICKDEELRAKIFKERLQFEKEKALQGQINTLENELSELKKLVRQLMTKE